jgi:hypothetical protein
MRLGTNSISKSPTGHAIRRSIVRLTGFQTETAWFRRFQRFNRPRETMDRRSGPLVRFSPGRHLSPRRPASAGAQAASGGRLARRWRPEAIVGHHFDRAVDYCAFLQAGSGNFSVDVGPSSLPRPFSKADDKSQSYWLKHYEQMDARLKRITNTYANKGIIDILRG